MKIQVKRRDGRCEVITLTGTLTVNEGETFSCLASEANGQIIEHFFTPAGLYDGWEMGVMDMNLSPTDAMALVKAVEQGRQILPFDASSASGASSTKEQS